MTKGGRFNTSTFPCFYVIYVIRKKITSVNLLTQIDT
jgi:hypothetical protein